MVNISHTITRPRYSCFARIELNHGVLRVGELIVGVENPHPLMSVVWRVKAVQRPKVPRAGVLVQKSLCTSQGKQYHEGWAQMGDSQAWAPATLAMAPHPCWPHFTGHKSKA